jgi:hypothetical protein
MSNILDLPPQFNHSPNYKLRIGLILILIALSILFKFLHLPFNHLILILGFGILSAYALHGKLNKLHPVKCFQFSLVLSVLWAINCLVGFAYHWMLSVSLGGLLFYIVIMALSFISLQVNYHKKKQRSNISPGDL